MAVASDRRPHVDLAPPLAPVVRITDVLPDELVEWLLDVACAAEHRFHPSTGAAGAGQYGLASALVPEHRISLVLDECPEVFPWFVSVVRRLLSAAFVRLLMPPFFPTNVEIQMTAHGDGAFFRTHTDNGTYRLHRRTLSYVYFFGERERVFSGGELVFDAVTLTPERNSIVFFPSGCHHEVRPVQGVAPFRRSRFTINGWIVR